jgi:hypothetical protein
VGKDLLISNANGNRDISKNAATTYAKVFGHSAGWYLYGVEDEAAAASGEQVTDPQTVSVTTDDGTKLLLSYKFLGEYDPSDAELIELLAGAPQSERQEFLALLRMRRGRR